jgi:Acyl-coenzyme A:6-aminopenicillanic acid acyl-transferase
MSAGLAEQRLGDIRWLVITGERRAAFRALGAQMRAEIGEVICELPEQTRLKAEIASDARMAQRFRAVTGASAQRHPAAYTELVCLAQGAGADVDDLLRLTLRGDLGTARATGCSDIAITGGDTLIWAHNEDGDPALAGRSVLLTTKLDGEPCVTSWWYPGFLPGNTFTVSECGLAWGVDALPVPEPPVLPGRAFAARGMQACGSLDDATQYLGCHHTAGGFAYLICELPSARVAMVENGGDLTAMTMADPVACPLLWHTNHFRSAVPDDQDTGTDSHRRGQVLDSVVPRAADRDFLLGLLARDSYPRGVRQPGTAGVLTLCTVLIDHKNDVAMLASAQGTLVTLPVGDLAAGDPSRATVGHLHRGDGSGRNQS